jgi:hypothetical protein
MENAWAFIRTEGETTTHARATGRVLTRHSPFRQELEACFLMARVPASTQIEVIAALREIRDEVSRVIRKQPRGFSSPHEGYAFIRDRLDELWAQVRGDDRGRAREQAMQVAAMAVRFMIDIKDS